MATKNCTLVDLTKCQCCTLQGRQCSRSPKHGKFCTQHSNKCNTVGTSKQVRQKPITLRLRQVGQVKQVKQKPTSLPHKQSKQVKQKPNILSGETPDLVIKNICEQMKNTKNYRTLATTIQLSKRHKKLCQEYLDSVIYDKIKELKRLPVETIPYNSPLGEQSDYVLAKTVNRTEVNYIVEDRKITVHFRKLWEPEMIDDLMKKVSRELITKDFHPLAIGLLAAEFYNDKDGYNLNAYQKWRGHDPNCQIQFRISVMLKNYYQSSIKLMNWIGG
jgi:hypothetical protein